MLLLESNRCMTREMGLLNMFLASKMQHYGIK